MTAAIEQAEMLPAGVCRVMLDLNHSTLVDFEDLRYVHWHPWSPLFGHNGKTYVSANVADSVRYLHRTIKNTRDGCETDHINGDGLDNRRENLRTATASQNRANMGKPRRPDGSMHSSAYKGVSWDRSRGRWQSKVSIGGRSRNLGRYDDEIEAARAYDRAAEAHWGEFAQLNFPAAVSA